MSENNKLQTCSGNLTLQARFFKWLTWPFIILIKAYQLFISPLFPARCRFSPTCSVYSVEVLKKHGIIAGLGLATRRILRCHPGNPGGDDPVP